MLRNIAYYILIISLSYNIACGQMTFEEKLESLYKKSVPLIGDTELKDISDNEVYILDTRSEEEFEVSHIQGAQFVDYKSFEIEDVKSIPKDATVIVYCSVGYRSERIGEKMLESGYENVNNLYGGIFNWKNNGHQVVNNLNLPTDSVHTYNKRWSKWLEKGVKVYD